MTALSAQASNLVMKYPVLIEMEKLFPEGVPPDLSVGLNKKAIIWEKFIAQNLYKKSDINLYDQNGENAVIRRPSPGQQRLIFCIYRDGSPFFTAEYEDDVSCFFEAFECGFLTSELLGF